MPQLKRQSQTNKPSARGSEINITVDKEDSVLDSSLR